MALDIISALPQPILQQILCFLPQAEAVKTCVLSKPWRHLGCTRPKVEFREESFKGKEEETFLSVVEETLQRYHDQNLSINELRLQVSKYYSYPAARLLEKWVPKLKIIDVYLVREGPSPNFHIPSSSVFKAESLQNLYLERCTTLDQKCVVQCKHLKTLHLKRVIISDETLKMIFSSCPLLESVTIRHCCGLSAIKVDDKLRNLKHFEFANLFGDGIPSIEFDVPSSAVIERIVISLCPVLFRNDQRNLKSLSLTGVRLSKNDLFSCSQMPSLEFLELIGCFGFEKLHLSSRSIKHLVFRNDRPCKDGHIIGATMDAPNILIFDYSSFYLPSLFSFTTTTDHSSPRVWKSNVKLHIDCSSWFLKLYGLLKELSGSEISLLLSYATPLRKITRDVKKDKKPVVVEHLELWLSNDSMAPLDFVNELFGICHPRILHVHGQDTRDFLSKFLKTDTAKKRHYFSFSQQDLEDVSMETHGLQLKWKEI